MASTGGDDGQAHALPPLRVSRARATLGTRTLTLNLTQILTLDLTQTLIQTLIQTLNLTLT